MSTTVPGGHFPTLPPSTRGALASSTSSSNTSAPISPLSVSSLASGTGHILSNSTASGIGRNERNKDDYGGERIHTVKPGTSLINMNTSSSTSNSIEGTGTTKPPGRPVEHLGSHEHHTYTTADDLEEFPSPVGSNNGSGGYRQYQQHAGAYGSPRQTGAQLRANRAAVAGTTGYGANQPDIYSPGGGVGNLHALHSKGSNLSTSTFIATSSRDREKERLEREPLPSTSNQTTPGPGTPTPGGMMPFTPSLQQTMPGITSPSTPSTPAISSNVARNKASAPNTPTASVVTLPHTPQSASSALGSIPAGIPAPSHPAVTRTKSTISNSTTAAAGSPSNHRSSGSRRGTIAREREREGGDTTGMHSRRPKPRLTPHLPTGPPMELAAPTLMYWSRAPVYGLLPTRRMRAHSVTLVDNTAWLFGGCDERGCARDVWCCDVETFQWTQPILTGDIPPPCRAHTATLVDGKKIFIFGGGEGPTYYNSLYILDTQSKRYTRVPCGQPTSSFTVAAAATAATQPESGTDGTVSPSPSTPSLHASSLTSHSAVTIPFTPLAGGSVISGPAAAAPPKSILLNGNGNGNGNGNVGGSAFTGTTSASASPPSGTVSGPSTGVIPPMPLPRRAHTAVLYKHKLVIFGGGNGVKALNDVWSLDTSVTVEKMRWEKIVTHGSRPGPRGYHTANLVGNIMIVVGGSDGRDCFADIWVLNLDTLVWTLVETDKEYKRLSHSSTQVGSYLFIMGGHDGTKYSSELLLFNLVTLQFENKATAGRPPPARGYHIALLGDARLLIFGGFDGHSVYDDVWILDLAGAAYLPQVTSFALLIDNGA